jgi:hypothetical protein
MGLANRIQSRDNGSFPNALPFEALAFGVTFCNYFLREIARRKLDLDGLGNQGSDCPIF